MDFCEKISKKNRTYLTLLLIIVLIASIAMFFLFIFFAPIMVLTLNTIQGAWFIIFVIVLRIILTTSMAVYCLHLWLTQDKSYLDDLPNLLFLFFLFFTFGKVYDIFQNLVTLYIDRELNLLIMKVRYIIVVLSLIPMLYFSLKMVLTLRSIKNPSLTSQRRKKIVHRSLSLILIIEFIIILSGPSMEFISILLPIIAIISLLVIAWVFYIAHKTKSLFAINPIIVSYGFFLYLFTQLLRPILYLTQEVFVYSFVSEILDALVFLIVFWGLISKPHYLKASR
ncbi:MAG: hypothetical protein GF353_08415 [Candidatus Lokiarchaeota archaeon]|nr:hypothetical protein [Candidatus Lokiarchaeota archaeon]